MFRKQNTLERQNGTNKIRNIARNESYHYFDYKGNFDTKSQTILKPSIHIQEKKPFGCSN